MRKLANLQACFHFAKRKFIKLLIYESHSIMYHETFFKSTYSSSLGFYSNETKVSFLAIKEEDGTRAICKNV